MKNLILILVIFLTGEIFSQITAPSSYTTNYGYRKWAQGANPSADSINANWNELDADIKAVYDTAQTKLNLYGSQTVTTGTKTILSRLDIGSAADRNAKFVLGNFGETPIYAGELVTTSGGNYLRFYGAGDDTVAMLSDIRDGAGGYAVLAGASFTGDVSVGQDLRTPYDSVSVATTSITADNKSFLHLYTAAAPQDLETINGGSDGKILYLINTDVSGYAITIKDGIGNILTAGDFVMGQYDSMTLIYNSVASKWIELSRSNN